MTKFNIKEFKDGVSDGLLTGTRDDSKRTPEYKEGYDFGLYLWLEDYDLEDAESENK
jgi:hypothetical protein